MKKKHFDCVFFVGGMSNLCPYVVVEVIVAQKKQVVLYSLIL